MTLAAVDVDYRVRGAVAGCVLFDAWAAAVPARELIARADQVEPYVPGELYRRELPLLAQVLAGVGAPLEVVIVDGQVWLDGAGREGLGAHLWHALGARTAVVGVAKTRYAGAPAIEILRGGSGSPLFITAVGMDATEAAERVRGMHGEHRLPTLLKRVDRLCREAAVGPGPPAG